MSDGLDKVAGTRRLPIFPLPLVLLPNEVLPLHIFEDRYREMLADVISGSNIFGVTLFERGQAFADKPLPGTVGTAAEVRESEMLADGRSNILTVGVRRYRLLEYVGSASYLEAEVEFFEDEPDPDIQGLADAVLPLFVRMAKAAHKLGGDRGAMPSDRGRARVAMHLIRVIEVAFQLAEKRQDFLPAPAFRAGFLPIVVIIGDATEGDHAHDGRAAAKNTGVCDSDRGGRLL
jgi:Lon protease-like protein